MPAQRVPPEVGAINKAIGDFLNQKDDTGRVIGNARYGIYAFYDYDGEPIYVGQTTERLRVRIRRHLTNQRTDAVAMNVLDPFEVAEVEIWPFYLEGISTAEVKDRLAAAEYNVFQKVLQDSTLKAVLNEKDIPAKPPIALPDSHRKRIVPEEIFESRKHPDTRIARRAQTIAQLARVISERDVSKGLRRTLLTQAKRLERLATQRLSEIEGLYPVETLDDDKEVKQQ
ncbi:MAG: GIY-YIG nuclease family protein [Chloroflexia bacterium]